MYLVCVCTRKSRIAPDYTRSSMSLVVRYPNWATLVLACFRAYRLIEIGPRLHTSVKILPYMYMPCFHSDIEPPTVTGCPFDTTIPVTMPSSRVTHSWTQPGFTDNSGPPSESFGCSSTGYNECHQSGSGLFSVGITKVMYNATDGARNRVECSFTVAVTGLLNIF